MKYIKPEMETILFNTEDVVTNSYTEGETNVPVFDGDNNGEEW
jgi:hypothetical protein